MSMKYNSVADIPEGLKWLAENITEWPKWNDGSEVEKIYRDADITVGYGRIPLTDYEDENDYTRAEWDAAKECLARCESEGEAVKWDGGLPPVDEYFTYECPRLSCFGVHKCKYLGSEFIVAETQDGHEVVIQYGVMDITFRTLKTDAELAAEKAAKERENAVNFVADIIRRADAAYAVDTLCDSDLAEYIVDATGYRIKGSE